LVGVFACGWILGYEVTAVVAIWVFLWGLACIIVVQTIAVWRRMPTEYRGAKPVYSVGRWAQVSVPILAAAGFAMANRQASLLMVGQYLDPVDAGRFAAVFRTAAIISMVINSVNAMASPAFAYHHSRGEGAELRRMVRRCAHLVFWPAAAACLVLGLMGETILGWFGPSYVVGKHALQILLIGHCVNAATGSVGSLLNMTGNQKPVAVVFGLSMLLQIALNTVLIPLFGIEGAALSTVISYIAWNVALHILVSRRLGIQASVLFALKR
jgi:O-antigen/teichoic acid export membrane protein